MPSVRSLLIEAQPQIPPMANKEPDSMRINQRQKENWQPHYRPFGQTEHNGVPSFGLIIAGVAVVGLGLFACNKLGRDLVRYIKIERM